MTDLELAYTKAKLFMMQDTRCLFYSTVFFSLSWQFTDTVPTAATNGTTIMFNPDFFMEMSQQERVFVMLHEAMHVAYMHVDKSRKGSRNHEKWNRAGDYVINGHLIESGLKMPAIGLHDPKFAGMSTEQVYDLLPDGEKSPWDDLMPQEAGQDSKQLQEAVDSILVKANLAVQKAQQQGKPGHVPGDLQIYLDKLLKPELPWQTILRRYLNGFSKEDYSYKKFNKKFLPEFYMPTLYSESMGTLVIAVDTSGSVSDSDFAYFISETSSIIRKMKPKEIQFIQFDTRIKSVDRVTSLNQLMNLKFSGRGGTDASPVIEWVNKHKPQVTLVFTDGEFHTPSEKSSSPLLWLIHNNKEFTSDIGKVIHYNMPH